MKLDAKNIATLDLNGKTDVIHFDDAMTGFGYRLRAGAGGKVLRTWVVQYRRGGATRRLLLGSGEVLNAEQARGAAKKLLAKVALGEDPQGDKVERRGKDRLSLRSVIDDYLAARRQQVRPKTFLAQRLYLTGPYFRPLHAMPVDKVSRRDVASRLVAITREHSSNTAKHARAALNGFFVWSMKSGIVEANPVINTLKPDSAPGRERTLSDDELAAIWRACEDDDHGRIIRLLILTGCRRKEIGSMCWSEIDLEHGTWTLPAARSKNHRAHTLPLMPAAMQIIEQVPHRATRDQLFGMRSSGYCNWGIDKRKLDARCGVTEWTVHDIRRSVATGLANLGTQPHVIEQILNHQSGHRRGAAGIYNRSVYDREVRAALALWSDHIRSIVDGDERKILILPQAAG